jgi:hypothetical protein
MPRTQIGTTLIENGSVRRSDMNITTSGEAVITKVLVNSPLTISSTGVNPGTGDVTLSLNTSNLVTSFNTRVGAVVLTGTDVTNALGFLPISGESDPTVPTHVKSITTQKITEWNDAFSWGNHASAGYLIGSVGWTGRITILTNPPGQQNIQVQNGQITNVS